MPFVFVMRHGYAEAGVGKSDAQRELTPEGRVELAAAARGLVRLAVKIDGIVASPLVRTRQTAAAISEGLGLGLEVMTLEALRPGGPPQLQLEEIGACGPGGGLLVVGHAPDVGLLVGHAASGQVHEGAVFEPGTMACLHFPGRVRAGAGTLRWLMSAAQLGLLGGAGTGR